MHQRHHLTFVPLTTVSFLCLWMISASWAGFTSVSGNIDVSNVSQQGNPGFDDFRRNQLSDDNNMLLFVEQQQLTLAAPLAVNSTAPGAYNAGNLPPGGTIASGTTIDSWLLHQDTDTSVKTFTATIMFDVPILGVIVHPTQLNNSDFLAGCCTFDAGYNRRGSLLRVTPGTEPSDNYTVSADGKTLTITMRTNSQVLDEIRIITEGSSTVPITLGYFLADTEENLDEVTFHWQTVTEVGNLGFHLYGKSNNENWIRLNAELIPSNVGDSVDVRSYTYRINAEAHTVFSLADVDVFGREIIHGPFQANEPYGVNRTARPPTNWKAIRTEHQRKQDLRRQHRQQVTKRQIQQLESIK